MSKKKILKLATTANLIDIADWRRDCSLSEIQRQMNTAILEIEADVIKACKKAVRAYARERCPSSLDGLTVAVRRYRDPDLEGLTR